MGFYAAQIELEDCRDKFLVEAADKFATRRQINQFTMERDGKVYPFIEVQEVDIDKFEFSTAEYIAL